MTLNYIDPNVQIPFGEIGYIVFKRCVDTETLVLCDDLSWRKAGSLSEGQGIIGFDANSPRRYIKLGTVVHNSIEEADCIGIELDTGEILYSTPDHPWLVRMSNTQLEWRDAKDLAETRFGGPVYLPRVFGEPWEKEMTYESGYLAASYDGEGYVDRTNGLTFTQVDNPMLERVSKYLEDRDVEFYKAKKSKESKHSYSKERQDCFDLRFHGFKNIVRLLGIIDSKRVTRSLVKHLAKGKQLMRCDPSDMIRVVRVFDAGRRNVAILSTSTETHFTAGFPSHNTYARRLKEDDKDSKTEEYWQVVKRELEASDTQLKVGFTDAEKKRYFETRTQLKWSVAGRFMWQLGTRTVKQLGLPSLQNCAFTVVNEPIRPFTWAFEMLMLGSGVGYNIQRHNVYQIPKLKGRVKIERKDSEDADYIVPDTREGWVKLLGKVLKAHFYSGEGFSYSTQLVRSKGAPIRGFGGVSSGPEELCWGIEEISKILNSRAGKKLRPIDCLDIMNIIGFVVVSGNVRRSAQLALGDHDDIEFIKAKRWDLGPIPNWRAMSNNSVVAPEDLDDLPQEFWDTYQQGEPYGLINLALSREVGRVGDTGYPDPLVEGYNPCAEQSLEDKETCCLSIIYLPNIESYEELLECLTYSYRMNKHSLALHCHLRDTEKIVNSNMRMGIGMAGYLQATEEQRSWLSKAYEWLRNYDKEYSKENGFPESIKLTTMKPDGTNALVPRVTAKGRTDGVITPGALPNPAGPYYIRRVIISSNSPLIEVCRKNGYHVEPRKNNDGSDDRNAFVVHFPCRVSEDTPVASSFGWRQQLDIIRRLQREWSDNSVSCTVYYKKEDLPEIKAYLKEHFRREIKSVSFLLYQGHGFVQAPYETITKEQYEEMKKGTIPITSVEVKADAFDVMDCSSGACPIR